MVALAISLPVNRETRCGLAAINDLIVSGLARELDVLIKRQKEFMPALFGSVFELVEKVFQRTPLFPELRPVLGANRRMLRRQNAPPTEFHRAFGKLGHLLTGPHAPPLEDHRFQHRLDF